MEHEADAAVEAEAVVEGDSVIEAERPHASVRRSRRDWLIAGAVAAVTIGIVCAVIAAVAAESDRVEARTAYLAVYAELRSSVADAKEREGSVVAARDTLAADAEVAEALTALLGADGETLAAAAETTAQVRTALDGHSPAVAPPPPGKVLPEDASIEAFREQHALLGEQLARWDGFGETLTDEAETWGTLRAELLAAWTAHVATVPDAAEAAIGAAPDAGEDAKTAVRDAAAALTGMESPLQADAAERWTAYTAALNALAQAQADAEAARRAAEEQARASAPRNSRSGGGSSGGGRGCQSASCSTGPSLDELIAGYTAELRRTVAAHEGVSVSDVNCFDVPPRTTRCTYPGGYTDFWI
ncbi:hypothetical protein [Salinibacterium sp. ZJ77]|uniref:hypothetical protein n=1 Tax=Salinibacterium sp. ZJ77 TaxID=2708337 RepID=UPI001423F34F|nr:hypothetical protein [Salinibacterium sp. ZJ77]